MYYEELKKSNMEHVVREALRLFYTNGIMKTKISDIAEATVLTPTSIYRYFHNKETLVMWSLILFRDEIFKALYQDLDNYSDCSITGRQQTTLILKNVAEIIRKDHRYCSFFAEIDYYLHSISDESAKKIVNSCAGLGDGDPLFSALKQGQADGSIRDDLPVREIYETIMAIITGAPPQLAYSAGRFQSYPFFIIDHCMEMILKFILPEMQQDPDNG